MFKPDPMLVTLLQAAVTAGASDLHLSVGRPPTVRRDGVSDFGAIRRKGDAVFREAVAGQLDGL